MPPKTSKTDVKKSVFIRKEQRAMLKRMAETAQQIISSTTTRDSEIDELNAIKVSLTEKKSLLREMDSQIFDSLEEEDLSTDIADSFEFEQELNKCIVKIDRHLSMTKAEKMNHNYSESKTDIVRPKLPKLTLNNFSGKPQEWLSFWDSFESAIHNNPKLSEVDKFQYLKGQLTDAAKSRIAGLTVVGENYLAAVQLLKETFGDPQKIISSHMEDLLNLEEVTNAKDINRVRTFYDTIVFHVRNLKTLGIEADSYGSLLMSIVISKLPQELKLWVTRETKNWNMDELLTVLKKEIEIRERLTGVTAEDSSKKTTGESLSSRSKYSNGNGKPYYKTRATASTLVTASSQQGPVCVYCVQQHPSSQCHIVTDVQARKNILKRKNKCFLCLRSGHNMRDCYKKNYNCFQCGGKHNKSICESKQSSYVQDDKTKSATFNTNDTAAQPVTSNITVNNNSNILLQTAVGKVCNTENQHEILANLVFDSCSQRTYCSEKIRQSLCLKTIGRENLLVKAFGEESPRLKTCDIVQLAVKSKDDMLLFVTAYCVPSICSPISEQLTYPARNYAHLQGLEFANSSSQSNFDVDLLIGADFYWNFIGNEVRRGEYPGPVAIWSRLGWILSGPVSSTVAHPKKDSSVCLVNTHVLHIGVESFESKSDYYLHDELRRFWDLESIGISQDESKDNIVMTEFREGIQFNNSINKYEVKLPFKPGHHILEDHYLVCLKRLNKLLLKLRKTPNILIEYDKIIKEQLEAGVIEKVEIDNYVEPGTLHYNPHREVIRLDKETTKLRIVYNASSKCIDGPSLNECLYSGPSLNPLIFDTLLRFRFYAIAVVADIQKAFLNISIASEHRDYLRFLWIDDPFSENPNIVAYRFNRVVFGVSSSPFILNAVIRHHLYSYFKDKDFVQYVLKSLYVDDLACGAENVSKAFEICKKLKLCMQTAGFNLRKWDSNSQEIMDLINECTDFNEIIDKDECPQSIIADDDRGFKDKVQDTNRDCSSVLGIKWNSKLDILYFDFSKMLDHSYNAEVVTKRTVLSFTAKFFDPLGLISPIIVLFKLQFQKLCEKSVGWDNQLDTDFINTWIQLVNSLRKVNEVSLSRCICSYLEESTSLQFHVFGDASEKAYGACVYLRCEHADKTVHCNLIAAKSRITPIKKQTIPRLELLACLIGTKLLTCIKEAVFDLFDIPVYFWSDSQVALAWIKNSTKKYKQFVNNRVIDIRKLSDINSWFYCPTNDNPADILSRGSFATDLIVNDLWWKGPVFLQESEVCWPSANRPSEQLVNDLFLSEVKRSTVCLIGNTVIVYIEKVVDITRYSSLSKLLRVTAYVLRFVNKLRHRKCHTDKLITVKELEIVENLWLKNIQQADCVSEKFRKRQQTLNIKQDENGILRCYGRLGNSDLEFNCKYPIILPENHVYTKLLVQKSHINVKHNGTSETLVDLRQKYWVCRGRQVVKSIISKCTICKRLEGQSYGVPLPPPLPAFRLSDNFAFQNVGVDYAGPLYVKDLYSNNQEMNKAFIALYTCASSRAIHLDLVPDASAGAFIRSFKRFIGRRGIPTLMNSDNSLTFKNSELNAFIQARGIKWKYNVERSPWWGGYFERLVKSTKRCLKKCLGTARITFEELLTLLVDIEGVLNSRPLTYVDNELFEPLTPSHLIIGRRVLSTPSCDFDIVPNSSKASDLQKRHKYIKTILSHYWKRWKHEYVIGLREYHRSKSKSGPEIKVGDVVMVYDDKITRLNWELALVEKVLIGRDNKIRSAIVRVHDKSGKIISLNRPIQKLYPLELIKDS